ncbi:hypothetical protein [Enterococcus cecorum]|uniref:hypothetical protein n=1 Tax=Enterococcus cecorum TaxID=44008 RepID=UPI0013A60A3F|nr:hypothetical protein [Enterococcus cecorum]
MFLCWNFIFVKMYGWQKLNVNSFMYENKGEDGKDSIADDEIMLKPIIDRK